ncbi:hypothetical protein [Morganella morganii]|uniref:hypothetical protein n=1 Tax=Morganella morganii TaxID=582 RepID=UPI001419AE19|nr:hypothetical protein [Morganella morganii]NIH18420.1 hypothetical protein [Morganella morganii]
MMKVIVGAFISTAIVMVSGCGEKDKYDGNYTCDVFEAANNISIREGSKYTFPAGTKRAEILIKDKVITIKGMSDGEYISPKLDEFSTEFGNLIKYEDDSLKIGFSPSEKTMQMSSGKIASQWLKNCESK